MLHRRAIRLRGEFSLNSSEAKMIQTMRESGSSREEMIAAWQKLIGSNLESSTLRVDYYLGNIDSEEFAKHLTPKEPQSIQLIEEIDEGYLLRTSGAGTDFDVLLRIKLSVPDIHALLANHQEDLCWLAYKNYYEENPVELKPGINATPISMDDIKPLLS